MESVGEPGQYTISCAKCHDRFCVPCTNERAFRIRGIIAEKLDEVEVRFLTLTLKTHEESLRTQLERLYASFRRLRQRLYWKRHVKGGVAFCEVKWSARGDRWHPHLHVLVQGRYMAKKDLGREWHAATGDSYVVDIRAIRDRKRTADYVAKYATKGYDASVLETRERIAEAVDAFVGRRFVITFGGWKGIDLRGEPPTKGWRIIDALSVVLRKAKDGDPNACRILAALRREIDPNLWDNVGERAPPDGLPERTTNGTSRQTQPTLFCLTPTPTQRYVGGM